jgi:oxalate decarboxylase/phosphoglucose isomerase-like protein (cupin superfamily)
VAALHGLVANRRHLPQVPPGHEAHALSAARSVEWFNSTAAAGDTLTALLQHQHGGVAVAVQEAGDILFVPDGWAHAVINLDESVALATEFVHSL